MNRRHFLQNTAFVGGTLAVAGTPVFAQSNAATPFNLNYAPHFGMFENHAGKDFLDQLQFMADNGFRAFEDNGMLGRPVELQTKIGEKAAKLGMTMGVFVIEGGENWKVSLATGKQEHKDTFLKACKASVECAKRVNAKWMTVVPGFYERKLPIGIQTAHILDVFRRGAEIFEPHSLVMVPEPLSDTPDVFFQTSDQIYMMCKAVNSPSCKFIFDLYHLQRNEGHLLTNLERTWDEVAYIQTGDNPGRKEPTTGEVNYKRIFEWIYNKGFKGVLGMEHGNFTPGKEGELNLIKAYREVDGFK